MKKLLAGICITATIATSTAQAGDVSYSSQSEPMTGAEMGMTGAQLIPLLAIALICLL